MPHEETPSAAPQSHYPITVETVWLRGRLEQADLRYRRAILGGAAMILALVLVFSGVLFHMTTEHAKAMKTATNAMARIVKHGADSKEGSKANGGR